MKSLTALAAILLACLSMAACEGGWLKEDKEQFLQSCRLGRPRSDAYCQCRLEQTMKTYPTINGMLENYDSAKLRAALKVCDQQ